MPLFLCNNADSGRTQMEEALINDYLVIKDIVYKKAKETFGDILPSFVVERIEKELKAINRNKFHTLLEFYCFAEYYRKENVLYIPRLSLGNSLIMYFLEISNVNPLPKFTYCPNCHEFYWGPKQTDKCDKCGEDLISDGYNLPFELFADSMSDGNIRLNCSSNLTETKFLHRKEDKIVFVPNKGISLAKQLGLSQNDINQFTKDVTKILNNLNKDVYARDIKKNSIVSHQAYIGIPDLGSALLSNLLKEYPVSCFEDLVDVTCMIHGTGVYDANEENLIDFNLPSLKDCICSRDDLYNLLIKNQIDINDAIKICHTINYHSEENLSDFLMHILQEAEIEEKYIDFLNRIHYTFFKAHQISHLRVSLKLAEIYLDDPVRYYKAYFEQNKEALMKIDLNSDLIRNLVNTKSTELEEMYLAVVDLTERGFNGLVIANEIKKSL